MREVILDADKHMSWEKIYEALNECFGTDYAGWQKACWPNGRGNGKFRAWFNKLAIKDGTRLKAAVNDCVNTISADWNEFVFDDMTSRHINPEVFYDNYDLIFSKDENGPYIFRGVFKLDREKSSPCHWVSRRVGKRVKITGSPAADIEILDLEENVTDINDPMKPAAQAVENGIQKIICGRCGYCFIKAPRCPECGQLQKY